MISENPSVQKFRRAVTKQNESLIYKKRISILENGAKFPKLPQKVHSILVFGQLTINVLRFQRGKSSYIFAKVTEYNRTVHWGDYNQQLDDIDPATYKTFRIFDVKHLIVGEACPHIKDNT